MTPADVPSPETAEKERIPGVEKAAVLLIALGSDRASKVLRALKDEEVERVSVAIAKMRNISSKIVDSVLLEYRDMRLAHSYIAQGGTGFAREVLEEAMGPRRAEEIMMRVEAAVEVSAFHLLQTVETSQLTSFIENEHPQTAALILSHLNPRKAADILKGLEVENQSEIMYRLATMGKTSPALLKDIEDVIRQEIGTVFGTDLSSTGGTDKVAEILNNAAHASEREILDAIREIDKELANDIKALMFVFEDLEGIQERDLQRLLTEVEQRDLAIALKAASEPLKEKILGNVSERVAEAIEEEIELMGPVRVSEVAEAQRRILDVAQDLEAQDEIVLSRVTGDMLI